MLCLPCRAIVYYKLAKLVVCKYVCVSCLKPPCTSWVFAFVLLCCKGLHYQSHWAETVNATLSSVWSIPEHTCCLFHMLCIYILYNDLASSPIEADVKKAQMETVATKKYQEDLENWKGHTPRKATMRMPKMINIEAAQACCPPGSVLWESTTEQRVRIFLPLPGRPSTGCSLAKGLQPAIMHCVKWAWQQMKHVAECPYVGLLD